MVSSLSTILSISLCCAALVVYALAATRGVRRFHHFFGRTAKVARRARSQHGAYKELCYTQKLDHFNVGETRTFQQRYLVNDDHWNQGSANPGPMLLYAGNEGDITLFYENTGLLFDMAKELNGLVVFIEHRYYGKSMPFGDSTFKDVEHLSYLTSLQALADFAQLVTDTKQSIFKTEKDFPVIAFGGSYGGMLAAWLRMKYPHVVAGSIAGSAPIWWFTGLTPCNSAYVTITQDFAKATPDNPDVCSNAIRNSWSAIDRLADTTGGFAWLSHIFKLCTAMTNLGNVAALKDWLSETYFNLAMANYPIPANFLAPLPAWPVTETCKHLNGEYNSDTELVTAIADALSVYYNYTGKTSCYSIGSADNNLGDSGWNFQACSEMVMPMCSDGVSDMFEPMPWDIDAYEKNCSAVYGITPQPKMPELMYGGKNIKAHSNIVFSNGLLDPWSGGGVLKDISDTLVAVTIPDGAHHYDLRGYEEGDTSYVVAARTTELNYVKKWIEEY